MNENKNNASSVLVLIVTTQGDEEAAIEAIRNGARDYLEKPREKHLLPGSATPVRPGLPPATVTLGQYHKIRQAVRFINDNYAADIRLDAVAKEAGMSLSHFSRIFRRAMGLSYQEYVNSRRITMAKNLLRTTPRSVIEIARSVGFADSTGFGRIFKKLTGQTPSAYRSPARK